MAAAELQYEDAHAEFDGPHCYASPNEEFLNWRELLKYIPVYEAAGIASGGEVGFFSLLPLVRKRLVLVDHSYASLAVAMLKYLVMREHGWEKARKLFTDPKESDNLDNIIKGLYDKLPENVKKAYTSDYKRGYGDAERICEPGREVYDVRTARYLPASSKRQLNSGIKRCWEMTPEKLIKRAGEKLDKVSFVHGDMSDLAERGPFDVFYISNALQHTTRQHRAPDYGSITKVVKPGGYIIAAVSGSSYYSNPDRKDPLEAVWEKVDERQAAKDRGHRFINWTYRLYKTKEEASV